MARGKGKRARVKGKIDSKNEKPLPRKARALP
jgi:hypothetical protein